MRPLAPYPQHRRPRFQPLYRAFRHFVRRQLVSQARKACRSDQRFEAPKIGELFQLANPFLVDGSEHELGHHAAASRQRLIDGSGNGRNARIGHVDRTQHEAVGDAVA